MHSWIFQFKNTSFVGQCKTLQVRISCNFLHTKHEKRWTNKQAVFMFCFCAFLQICFPPQRTLRNLVEPSGGSEVKTRVCFLFPLWKSARRWRGIANAARLVPPSSCWAPRKKRQESGRGKEHGKREQPQHFYILDEITFFFFFRMKNRQERQERGWDFGF